MALLCSPAASKCRRCACRNSGMLKFSPWPKCGFDPPGPGGNLVIGSLGPLGGFNGSSGDPSGSQPAWRRWSSPCSPLSGGRSACVPSPK